jgi:hypothetical protein
VLPVLWLPMEDPVLFCVPVWLVVLLGLALVPVL